MKELICVTYLMTREDYINCRVAEKTGKTDEQDNRLLIFAGIILCAVGAITYIFRIKFLELYQEKLLSAVFGIVGICLIAYHEFIMPMLVKIKADGFCKRNPEKMISHTITLCDTAIKIKNDRYSAALPYEMLNGFFADKKTIVIYINKIECVFVPKRTLDEQVRQNFISLLREKTAEL